MLALGAPRSLLARADLTGNAKVVWIALQMFVASDGVARPRLIELQQATGLPDKTLRDALKLLVERRLLVANRYTGGVTGFTYQDLGGPADFTGPPASPAAQGPADFTGPPCPFPASSAASSEQGPADFTGPPAPTSPTTIVSISPSSSVEVEGGAGGRGKRKRRVPTALPADWLPGQTCLTFARDHKPGVDVSAEVVKFRHWFRDGKGAGTMRADWEGTFLDWLGRARAITPQPNHQTGPGARLSSGMGHLVSIMRDTG